MYDRTEYDLRILEHQRRAEAANRRIISVTIPPPNPRLALATLLRALAARLDPATSAPPLEPAAQPAS